MRKLLSFLLIFNLAHATAPTGYKNETATAKTYAQDLVFPNNQLTKQAGLDSRIETGNTNLLVNPSFEHSTVATGWTITNATASADTTNQVEGKKALSLSLTGALNIYQDSTINAANLVGLQGNASIKIKTSDVDGLKVCARNAGVTSTSLCVNIPKDGAWKEVNIPNILTATSNGIAITSTGTTGTVLIDDAFVGTSAPFQSVSGAKLVGGVTITGCAGRFQTTSTTFASFGTQTGCVYTTFGQAVQPSVTNLPVVKFASLPPGDYIVEYTGAIFNATTGNNTWIKFHDGTGYMREEPWLSLGTSGGGGMAVSGSFSYSTTQSNITFEARGKIQNGTGNIVGSTAEPGVIKVYYYPPESKIYSQASQDFDWMDSGLTTSTSGWQGFGTLSAVNIQMKRKGSDLYLRGSFTQGTPTSVEYRVPLPTVGGQALTIKSGYVAPSPLGHFTFSAINANSQNFFIGASSSGNKYLNFYVHQTTSGYSIINSTTPMPSVGATYYIESGPIPIQEWQDYGVIVGSFAEVVTSPGQNNVESFSVSYGTTNATTVCSASPCSYLDQIGAAVTSVTRSSAGVYVMNLSKTYSKLKCTFTLIDSSLFSANPGNGTVMSCSSCNSITIASIRSSTGAVIDSFGNINCQGIK